MISLDAQVAFRTELIKSYAMRTERDPACVVLADPSQDDAPLVYVNEAFTETTGYARDEVIGRNCRFLQGPDTDPATVALIRRRLEAGAAVAVEILNYKKDGTPFWNALSITPVFDIHGQVAIFVGAQHQLGGERPRFDVARFKIP